ncbi:hypothetical protein C2845_PM03G01220 [Panicum miliaceum]|uniref:Uncharacterized protein n=1 Tax=Panicum miliaceum TaxID=4540 RepID=A0A3L6T6Z7_PANMI|nr:hypothetical protein C2845_PM03G01220 [Panicum miliaceum]
MDWLSISSTLHLKADDGGRAALRAMLWCGVAGAAAAVLALRQPAAAEPRLALALVAQAFIAATHCARIWLIVCLLVVAAEGGQLLLGFVVAVSVVMSSVYDLICFMALLRGVGVEEE